MARLIKFLLTTFVAGFFIFALMMKVLFDPNQYKHSIQSKITEKTGYVLDMPNPLTLGVFPSLGISTTDFSVKNTPQSSTPFLKAEQLEVKFKFFPLLLGRLVVRDIQLKNFNLFFNVAANGSKNWVAADMTELGKKATFKISRDTFSSLLSKLRLEAFTLKNGTLTWQDDFKGTHYIAMIETFHSGNMLSSEPYDIRLEANVANKKNKTASSMSFEAHILPNPIEQEHKIEHLRYTKRIIEHPYFKEGTQLQVLGQGLYDHNKKALSFPNFTLTGLGLEAEVPFVGRLLPEGFFVSGDVALSSSSLNQVTQYLNETPKTLEAFFKSEVMLNAEWQLSPEWLTLSKINANFGESAAEGKITFALDPSQLSQYHLNIDKLTLAPSQNQASEQPLPETSTPEISVLMPFAMLPKGWGEVLIDSLLWNGSLLSQVKLRLETSTNELKATHISAQVFEGLLEAKLMLQKDLTGFQSEASALLVQSNTQPLLSALGYPAPISGKIDLNTTLKSRHQDTAKLSQEANGPFHIAITEGNFKGIDLKALLRKAIKEDNNQEAIHEKANEAITPFSTLLAEGEYANNQLNVQKLEIKGPGWVMIGNGLIDTKAKVLNFDTKLSLIKENGQYSEYQNIPFSLSGAIEKPVYKLDFVHYLKKKARLRINQSLEAGLN